MKDIDNNLSKFSQKDNSGTYQVDKSSMVGNDIGDIFQFQANTLNQVKAGTTQIDGLIQGVQRTTVGIGVDEECVRIENNIVEGVDTRGESPTSFCNGLGTIYIDSLRGMTF